MTPSSDPQSVDPFRFYTSLVLQESTGLRAATLTELVRLLRTIPETSIYHHTHHFVLQHHYLTPEPSNDFAYWVTEVLGEETLGELLASIDTMEYSTLKELRTAVVKSIDRYLKEAPTARFKFASEGEEFFFMKSIHVVMPIPYQASTLLEFAEALEQISIHSLYFHIFDSRLRLGTMTNDFAKWIEDQLGMSRLARDIAQLDPYAHTLEALRATLLGLIHKNLETEEVGGG